jgi:hypothetical protein
MRRQATRLAGVLEADRKAPEARCVDQREKIRRDP